MHPLFAQFAQYLENAEKEYCVEAVLSEIEKGTIDIVTLYYDVLTSSLSTGTCQEKETDICIWKEHVRTAILRTIIECCYPYVIKERDERYTSRYQGKAMVVCPPGELHELGARMVTDFLTLTGFDTTFIGANTPQADITGAITYIKPKLVAVSITNYFNLVAAREAIARILKIKERLPFRVLLGGQACRENWTTCSQMGVDMVLDTFADIKNLAEA